ncbi:phospholipid methyltransferase [Paenibacillus polymyxa]|uniref:phospholipid methyltransferase n=1 Tax=Paenibacillus polymyxa TaxID=1406 RepID=UPI001F0D07B0|nr:phospholipid methyltransferase [Paenibacillus polymyxa]UMR35223.1 phospholipid methyltransferase [Paenibacillus polymyxa]
MEKKQMNFNEYLLFLQGFLTNPQRVGSLIPSSRFLAAKVVESVPWDEVKTVAELGSGTGAITRCMKTQLTGSTKVLLFERDKKMRENLKAEYPDFVCHSNACQLVKKLNHDDIGQLDCISLLLLYISVAKKRCHVMDTILVVADDSEIQDVFHAYLRNEGYFVIKGLY